MYQCMFYKPSSQKNKKLSLYIIFSIFGSLINFFVYHICIAQIFVISMKYMHGYGI